MTKELPGKTNALKMVLKGGDYRARITDLSPEQKTAIYNALGEWLNLSPAELTMVPSR